MRLLVGLALCACAACALANPAQPGPANEAARASTVFADRVRAYVTLQKKLEGVLPAQKPTTDVEQIVGRQQALARSIAAGRRDARQGDIFTPDVANLFHTIIREGFLGPDARNIRRTIQEGDPAQATVLQVNVAYPEDIPLGTMPPRLLRRLPALPMELAYRFIGRALVLKDVKTNLIVDVLPDAISLIR